MWVTLCPVDRVPDDDVVEVSCDGKLYCAYRIAGQHYVTDGLCTHQVARLAEGYVLDDIIECPMHNGRFHIPTGRVEGPPACEPLRTYRVRVEKDELEIWIDPTSSSGPPPLQ
jgi:nitrite reductase/ring-hydroxylating ferredoxin subunit